MTGDPRGHDRFIDSDGARLRVREAGSGAVVVLIHGWALDLDMWSPQFAQLAARLRLIAFDRRGFGLSDGAPSIGDDVADTARLLDVLGVPRAALVGMSQGVRVALQCALDWPERITCLVLDGPPPIDASAPDEVPLARYREVLARDGIDAVRRAWREHPLMRLRSADRGARELLAHVVDRYPGNDLREVPVEPPSLAGRLATLGLPALVLNGAYDSASRRSAARALADLLPDSAYATVPDAGHLPNLDHPAFYNALVTDFVTAHTISTELRP